MAVYLDLAVLLNFVVDLLLILGTNRITGDEPGLGRAAAGAFLGAVYAAASLLPGFRFLGNLLWKCVSLCMICFCAFGLGKRMLRRGAIFVFLSMALGGIAQAMGRGGIGALMAAAAGVLGLCVLGFRENTAQTIVPVELGYGEKHIRIKGLRDTGNGLRDPVTGQQVLVAGAEVAKELLGLSLLELYHPIETIASAKIRGLRLIPYKAVGTSGGMLLGIRLAHVRVGKHQSSAIVAFTPEGMDRNNGYQILTGGCI